MGVGLPRTGTRSLAKALRVLGYNTLYNPKNLHKAEYLGKSWSTEADALVHFGFWTFPMYDCIPVCTIRDEESWIESCRRHFTKVNAQDRRDIRLSVFGCIGFNEAQFRLVYHRHRDWVERRNVLCMDVKDGWEPLCKFLGKTLPDEPFPHLGAE